MIFVALVAASTAFVACNAQPATDEEMAELEAESSAADENADSEDSEADDETADPVTDDLAAADDDRPRNAHAEANDPTKVDEDEPAIATTRPTPAAAPMQLTASGARGAALQLGTSSTVTAPTVQLRVGNAVPSNTALRPQLRPANSLQLDLGATGVTETTTP
jgi:hypothetical protein